MTKLLHFLLLPFLRMRLRAAERHHQAAPSRDSVLRYAWALSAVGKHHEALQLLIRARSGARKDEELADALKQVRRRQASALLEEAQAEHRKHKSVDSSIRVANLLKAAGKPTAALRLITPLVTANPHNARVLRALGTIYLEQYQSTGAEPHLTRALEHLQRSLAIDPNDRKTLLNLAIAKCSAGHVLEATPLIEATLAACPTDRRALRLRAYCSRAVRGVHPGAGSRASPAAGRRATHTPTEEAALVDQVFAQESVRGVFAIARDGSVITSRTRLSPVFNFEDQSESLKSLAAASRFDGERIGIGPVHSCIVTGKEWQVAVLTHGAINIIAFCESEDEKSGTDFWFDQELTKPVATHA